MARPACAISSRTRSIAAPRPSRRAPGAPPAPMPPNPTTCARPPAVFRGVDAIDRERAIRFVDGRFQRIDHPLDKLHVLADQHVERRKRALLDVLAKRGQIE